MSQLMLPLILVTIGEIIKKWQQFFEIQDGVNRDSRGNRTEK